MSIAVWFWARRASRFRVGFVHFDDVAARRHELDRQHPPDHLLVRLQHLPAVARLELVREFLTGKRRLHLFGDETLQPCQHLIGHLRPAVREAVVGVLDGVFDQLLRGPLKQLGGSGVDPRQERDDHEKRRADACARHAEPQSPQRSCRHVFPLSGGVPVA
jgi:hypothetical protein